MTAIDAFLDRGKLRGSLRVQADIQRVAEAMFEVGAEHHVFADFNDLLLDLPFELPLGHAEHGMHYLCFYGRTGALVGYVPQFRQSTRPLSLCLASNSTLGFRYTSMEDVEPKIREAAAVATFRDRSSDLSAAVSAFLRGS